MLIHCFSLKKIATVSFCSSLEFMLMMDKNDKYESAQRSYPNHDVTVCRISQSWSKGVQRLARGPVLHQINWFSNRVLAGMATVA